VSSESEGKVIDSEKKRWTGGLAVISGGVIVGTIVYFLIFLNKEQRIENCISNYSVEVSDIYTNEYISSEVMGYSDIKILNSPRDSGYYLLDFNIRLLVKTKNSNDTQQKKMAVEGIKCFYDTEKLEEAKKRKNS